MGKISCLLEGVKLDEDGKKVSDDSTTESDDEDFKTLESDYTKLKSEFDTLKTTHEQTLGMLNDCVNRISTYFTQFSNLITRVEVEKPTAFQMFVWINQISELTNQTIRPENVAPLRTLATKDQKVALK